MTSRLFSKSHRGPPSRRRRTRFATGRSRVICPAADSPMRGARAQAVLAWLAAGEEGTTALDRDDER
jgi:hypothetical protein